MASATHKTIPLQVENLARYYSSLARTLAQSGISGGQLNEILSADLKARCLKCDIQISGAELEQVALAEDTARLAHPKLQRLRAGSCGRDGCESADYAIHLAARPDVDWEIVATKAAEQMSVDQAAAQEEERCRTKQARRRRTRRTAFGLLIVAFSFLLLFGMRHGRLSFVRKPHKYEIDPASVGQRPSR